MKRTFVDGDIIIYRAGFAAGEDPIENALHTVKKMLENIKETTEAEEMYIYISGEGSYRADLFPEYKANRTKPKPFHFDAIKNYLIDVHNATVVNNIEADDAMGIMMTRFDDGEACIATIDKDLLMIPGVHYNFVKDEFIITDETQGLRHFYKQMLSGDAVDNIPGLYKTTGRKAYSKYKDYIDKLETEEEMFEYVSNLYTSKYTDELIKIGKLLWIQQDERRDWMPPNHTDLSSKEELPESLERGGDMKVKKTSSSTLYEKLMSQISHARETKESSKSKDTSEPEILPNTKQSQKNAELREEN